MDRIDHRPPRQLQPDRAVASGIVGYLRVGDRAHDVARRRQRHRGDRVDRTVHLRAGAGEVDHEVGAVDDDPGTDFKPLVEIDAIVVQIVGERVLTVRNPGDQIAGHGFGAILEDGHAAGDLLPAELVDQLENAAPAGVAGRDLRVDVPQRGVGNTDVLPQDCEQRLVG